MNYIESITLENFQSHKKTTIAPAGPGQLTVIIGPSDSGKTALIRGLKWAAYNSPQGADFVRVGSQAAAVQITMGNGDSVTRYRSKGGVNRYLLETAKTGKQTFESFGSGVPLEIQQTLEISPINIGDMEFNLNLSEQLDGPFLGNATPSTARAKVLGKLSGVEEVDHAGKTLNTDLYRKRREVEGIRNQIEYLGKKIEEYKYLDELGPLTEIVDGAVVCLKNKIEKKQMLLVLKLKLAGTVAAIIQEEEKIASLSNLDTVEGALAALADSVSLYKSLTAIRTELASVLAQMEAAGKIIEQTNAIQTAERVLFLTAAKSVSLLALRKHSEDIYTITQALNRTEAILEATREIPQALEINQALAGKGETLKALMAKCTALEWLNVQMHTTEKTLGDTENVDALLTRIQAVTASAERKNVLMQKQSLLAQNRQVIAMAEKQLNDSALAVTRLTNELAHVYKEAAVCPLCGNALDPEKLLKEVV